MMIDLRKKVLSQLEVDIINAAIMGMSYGHYIAYQRSLAKKRKARVKKERTKERIMEWIKE